MEDVICNERRRESEREYDVMGHIRSICLAELCTRNADVFRQNANRNNVDARGMTDDRTPYLIINPYARRTKRTRINLNIT